MLLVTGATGHIGRELVRELDAKGAAFRVLARDPARAAGLPGAAECVIGDLDKPATLAPALDRVERLFLLVPGIGIDHTATRSPPRRRPGCAASCTCRRTQSSATRCPRWAAGTTNASR